MITEEEIARAIRTARLRALNAPPMSIIFNEDAPAEDADLASARAVLALVQLAIDAAVAGERERAARIVNGNTPIQGITIGIAGGLWADTRGNTQFVAISDVNEQLEQRAAAIRSKT